MRRVAQGAQDRLALDLRAADLAEGDLRLPLAHANDEVDPLGYIIGRA